MARIPDTISVTLDADIYPDLAAAIRALVRSEVRSELRRLSSELHLGSMRILERSVPAHIEDADVDSYKEQMRQQARELEYLADLVQASAKKSEMEERS